MADVNPWGFTDAELARYHEALADELDSLDRSFSAQVRALWPDVYRAAERRRNFELGVWRGRHLSGMRRAYRARRRRG